MESKEIRKKYLEFFKSKGHKIYPSSSLVPDDPTMLLTTAGMVQFKPYFEGEAKPKETRITTSQKCARTTDIDRVGHTARHLTFFEMLGNFSLGDYYKKEAIKWAWELLCEHYKLDKKKLWVTVFTDDDEAALIWEKETDIDNERIARLGAEHNFWKAGDVGPCGPSSEIIYDFGEDYSCSKDCVIGCDCDRWLEIWNLVFMQYECEEDGSLKDLPKKNIDTGMGLERISALLQNAKDNFHTDLLKPILDNVVKISGKKLGEDEKNDVSLKIITDHARAIAFMIADGVIPSNEGRGYVLRRLIRRSIRHGWLLGIEITFISKVLEKVIELMGDIYEELKSHKDYILRIASTEEERFSQTLRQGIELINDQIKAIKKTEEKMLSGDLAFKLHDTYGFPVELTAEIASENGLSFDKEKYDFLMKEQKTRAREAWKEEDKDFRPVYSEVFEKNSSTEFTGYTEFKTKAKIQALIVGEKIIKEAKAGDEVEIVLDKTCFYAEKGGQVADKGNIIAKDGVATVVDTKEVLKELVIHKAKIKSGKIKVGDEVSAQVDRGRRLAITRAHTATHLLHWALRTTLGNHIKQAGSFVEDDRLRFDFTHFEAMSNEEIQKVEKMVNEKILQSYSVKAYVTTLEYAKEIQAAAFFGEKYGDFVRVIEAGDFSKELCGGTHVSNTAFINLFKIISEGSVGASIRRIEAFTGSRLFDRLSEDERTITEIAASFRVSRSDVVTKVKDVKNEISKLNKELQKAKRGDVKGEIERVVSDAKSFNGINVIAKVLDEADIQTMRSYADALRNKLGNSAVMIATKVGERALIIASSSQEAVKNGFDSKKWLDEILPLVEGSGGGKASFAQGGGKKPNNIDKALDKAIDYVSNWAKKQ